MYSSTQITTPITLVITVIALHALGGTMNSTSTPL